MKGQRCSLIAVVTLVALAVGTQISLAEDGGCLLPEGLVSWWRGEGDAQDSFRANDGELKGSVTFAPGKVGQAFRLDGGYVLIPGDPSLNLTEALTLEAWVYPAATDDGHGTILSKWTWQSEVGPYEQSYRLRLLPDRKASFEVSSNGLDVTAVSSLTSLLPGQWSHVAGTYDGGALKIYVNGAMQGSVAFDQELYPGLVDVVIGAWAYGGQAFRGRIDEPAIYSRALSQGEIAAIAAAGDAGKCPHDIAPIIIDQPEDVLVQLGDTAELSVVAAGTRPIRYQWSRDGVELPGAAASTLVFPTVQHSDAGIYSVLVGNILGGVVSSNAVLTVSDDPVCHGPPDGMISWWRAESNPLDSVGENHGLLKNGATYAAGMVGAAFKLDGVDDHVRLMPEGNVWSGSTLSIEGWIRPGVTGEDQVIIGRRSGPYFDFVFALAPDRRLYLENTSAADWPRVNSTSTLPTNEWVHVAVTCYASPSSSRQSWAIYINGVRDSTGHPNEVAETVRLDTSMTIGGLRSGEVVESAFAGRIDELTWYDRVLSAEEIERIYKSNWAGKCLPDGYGPPEITTQPADLAVQVGEVAEFSVSATGTPEVTYQWQLNGTNLPNATASALVISNAQPADAGDYSVVVANAAGSVTSSNAQLTVRSTCNLPDGLVSWWRGEGDGLDSFRSNDGELKGSVTFAPGKVGQAFRLDGGYVLIPDDPSLNLSEALTLEAWVYPSATGNGSGTIISKWLVGEPRPSERSYNLRLLPDRRAGVEVTPNGSSVTGAYSSISLPPDQWSHVAGTYDGSALNIYVNGVLEDSVAYDLGVYDLGGWVDTVIGALGGEWGPYHEFTGMIDEPAIYSRALSAAEVTAIVEAGEDGKCPHDIAPRIAVQPEDVLVQVGDTAELSVIASGTRPFTYQWQRDGVDVSGATASNVVFSSVQLADAGTYSVLVGNIVGSVLSSNAVLTVSEDPVCYGPPDDMVSWWRAESNPLDSVSTNHGTLVNGATFAPGMVGQAFSLDGVDDHVRIKLSESVTVTPYTAEGITIEAWIKSADTGDWQTIVDAPFSSDPSTYRTFFGLDPDRRLYMSFAWDGFFRSDVSLPANEWVHVAAAVATHVRRFYINGVLFDVPSLGRLASGLSDEMAIGAMIRGTGGEPPGWTIDRLFEGLIDELTVYDRLLSDEEIAEIYEAGSQGKCPIKEPPVIVQQPQDQILQVGGTAEFTVWVRGAEPLSYQWVFEGEPLEGATQAVLSLSDLTLEQVGAYSVLISNQFGAATSGTAFLTVESPTIITTQPEDRTNVAGSSLMLNVTAEGVGTLSYQWSKDGIALYGQTNRTLVLADVTMADAGDYTVAVANVSGVVTSDPATVTIVEPALPEPIAGPIASPLDGSWYYLLDQSTWVEAQAAAEAMGSSLVTINDPADQDWVFDTFGNWEGQPRGLYIGLHDTDPFNNATDPVERQAEFTWVGEPSSYANWDSEGGEPNNYRELGEYYVHMFAPVDARAGKWNDAWDTTAVLAPLHGVVQVEPSVATIRLVGATAHGPDPVNLPVVLEAHGVENGLGFSLQFNSSELAFTGAALGTDITSATLIVNDSQAAAGKVGLGLVLSAGETLAGGTQEVLRVSFEVVAPPATGTSESEILFGDSPTVRQLVDAYAHNLPTEFIPAKVVIPPTEYEGDVAPLGGDHALSLADWLRAGRLAAALEPVTEGNEFRRADSAPRETLGDGRISVIDWVQAGRYAFGFDPVTEAGGPEAPATGGGGQGGTGTSSRTLSLSGEDLVGGVAGTVTVQVYGDGGEGAFGFSLAFDPEQLTYTHATLSPELSTAALNVNDAAAGSGQVGFAISLPIGSTLEAGKHELLEVEFAPAPDGANATSIAFIDVPVHKDTSDELATPLQTIYGSLELAVEPLELNITRSGETILLSWPAAAAGMDLQERPGFSSNGGEWTTLDGEPEIEGGQATLTLTNGSGGFYRLADE